MRLLNAGILVVVCAACGSRSGGGPGTIEVPDASINIGHKYVFVTDATWLGEFWIASSSWPSSFGPAQADMLCTNAAVGAGLHGTWRAWISSYGSSQPTSNPEALAADRITDVGPWYLVGTNTIAFNNKANLLNTPLVAIDVNEHGVELTAGPVWTGTRVGGQVLEDCDSWQTQDDQIAGTYGDLGATGNAWTEEASAPCRTTQAHLYCIEQ